ncbi:TetR family transcriptional regulator [Nocardia puris]|uniref:TetR family transcriptional regulator n=1 Tax=Nocardia puris TaxID=208602 RepID=A0A366DQZ7_9NOCA|nr:TetR family transcriptional regulator [Nocardia puris]MBF6210997.1 TetR family transcriptional regulator [Nocardia puris]MBF6364593.1 TetR family transcriptional regulator [Nocardia puris]MBF6459522.1 TetR family transcriptional regulator [Nocardia puris]RBO92516.1 TetR family transcriptional regulator [Nocardia puris]
MPRTGPRVPYQEAARELLRASVLDAMRELLTERDWSKITLGDVAGRAGVSRQTLYNEFGSRSGLAQAYALRLADDLVDHVRAAIAGNVGDVRAAFREGLSGFFLDAASDPLVRSLLAGEVKLDLLRLITLDAGPLLEHAGARLASVFEHSWVNATAEQSRILAHAVVRIALSYIPTPPAPGSNAPSELAELLGPYVEAILAAREVR